MKPSPPIHDVAFERKALYYAGMAVGAAGFLLFASNFLFIASGFGDPTAMVGGARGFIWRALGGMALVVAGQAMRNVGARGLAGSGMMLNPGQARRDMEPWSRMGGGMMNDALDEVPVVRDAVARLGDPEGARVVEVVRVRCPHCKSLNDEHDRFCGQCGERL
ncbi:zinc ribbon domain-containing protein [Paludisphaera rhizosphaerae]|uniref:zinc ribbon domain-containing protein n=1 Tax=Paludisphaera rhizosphaerae TaxID=2711216 RepID=UPI0013EC0742|nr:zinc ribbon domain-containing protein [Paludisphaera rhizosphaerae]